MSFKARHRRLVSSSVRAPERINPMVTPNAIRDKFGDGFLVDDHTYKLGIDHRFTKHFSDRFQNFESGSGQANILESNDLSLKIA